MPSKSAQTEQEGPFGREADSYSRGAAVTGVRLVAWLRLPPVSGLECAAALRKAGFRLRSSSPGIVDLMRHGELIRVPLAKALAPEALVTILRKAGIEASRFLELLDR
jgi:hypothetical protein